MPHLVCRSNGELVGIVQTFIKECSNAMHLEGSDESIPIRHRSPPASPGMQIVASQPARIGQQRSARNVRAGYDTIGDLLRVKGLAVEEQLSIEFARPPTLQNCPDGGLIDLLVWRQSLVQQIFNGIQVGGSRRNGTHVEIAIR